MSADRDVAIMALRTLELLEQNGSPDAFMWIKNSVPCYESAVVPPDVRVSIRHARELERAIRAGSGGRSRRNFNGVPYFTVFDARGVALARFSGAQDVDALEELLTASRRAV